MPVGLLGKKLGMTKLYDATGRAVPVTIVHVADNALLQVKTKDNDGYSAVQLGYDEQKVSRTTKPQRGHFEKSSNKPRRYIREFRLKNDEQLPTVEQLSTLAVFKTGQFVDAIGVSKGRGFTGVVKRHNFAGQPAAHGSMMHRRTGSVGCRSTPGRVWKNQGMPGHYGNSRSTVQNLQIMQVRESDGALLIKGSIAGPTGAYVMIRPAKKKTLV